MSDVYSSNDAPPDGSDYTPVDNFSMTNTVSAPTTLDNSNAYGGANSTDMGWTSLNSLIVQGGGSSMDGTVATIPTSTGLTYVAAGTSGTSLTGTSPSAVDWTKSIMGALGGLAPVVSSLAGNNTPVTNASAAKATTTATPSTQSFLMLGAVILVAYLLLFRK